MALMTRRSQSPIAEMVDWLETMTPLRPAWGEGLIPIEEFREDGHYVVRADLPGIDPDKDVTVTVDDGFLLIHGERREEEHDEHHSELRFGSFSRRLPLPKGCTGDDVTASYASGVLTVKMPADGDVPEPTRIPIARSGD
jgi:HSP20 family molecular chaperone IbpA